MNCLEIMSLTLPPLDRFPVESSFPSILVKSLIIHDIEERSNTLGIAGDLLIVAALDVGAGGIVLSVAARLHDNEDDDGDDQDAYRGDHHVQPQVLR